LRKWAIAALFAPDYRQRSAAILFNLEAKTMNKRERKLLEELATANVTFPNYYNGSGRWTQKSADYATALVDSLTAMGMVRGKHFERGNDAPFGGHTGEWVGLTPLGRRRKAFRDIRAAAAATPRAEPPKPVAEAGSELWLASRKFRLSQRSDLCGVLRQWREAGAAHPAPDAVVAAKRESGLTWKMIGG
jgi:hypothetical protein